MKKLSLSRNLMIAAIFLLAAFQIYWLNKLYKDEYDGLKKEVDVTFRETIYKLQKQRFEKDTLLFSQLSGVTVTSKQTATKLPNIKNKGIVQKVQPKLVNNTDTPKMAFAKLTFALNNPSKEHMFLIQDSINGILKNIDPSQIQSINIIKGNRNGSALVPPPGLMEVILKQRAKGENDKRDSFSINKDSLGRTFITSISYKTAYSMANIKEDSAKPKVTIESVTTKVGSKPSSTIKVSNFSMTGYINNEKQDSSPIAKLFTSSKSINDSLPIQLIDSAYKAELVKSNKQLSYNVLFKKASKEDIAKGEILLDSSKDFNTSAVLIGYNTPYSYQAKFNNIFSFILKKMSWQISGSLLLLLFVLATFISLYKNLLAQQKLAIIKNDFISNITHELKTPIATVNVAIEALRNFGGITNPERTKEYLDISASELQRLGLLVDKVLKLSMFENKDIELSKENFDLKLLTEEVLNTLKLQLEKVNATTTLVTSGKSFLLFADKLHITSVIYNLLDNAIKYSVNNAIINIGIIVKNDYIKLNVQDNGIGIPIEYKDKVFEKFFRVPTGNIHNTKGYGLGLSYVAHIVKKHNGFIIVNSQIGEGSNFIIHLPVQESNKI